MTYGLATLGTESEALEWLRSGRATVDCDRGRWQMIGASGFAHHRIEAGIAESLIANGWIVKPFPESDYYVASEAARRWAPPLDRLCLFTKKRHAFS